MILYRDGIMLKGYATMNDRAPAGPVAQRPPSPPSSGSMTRRPRPLPLPPNIAPDDPAVVSGRYA